MTPEPGGLRVGLASFGISLALNGLVLFGADRAAQFQDRRLAAAVEKKISEDKLEFEFVEAPPKAHPQEPSKETKKIAERDALSQDREPVKEAASGAPKLPQGVTDQLAQNPFAPPPQAAAPRAEASKAAEEKKAEQAKPERPEPRPSGMADDALVIPPAPPAPEAPAEPRRASAEQAPSEAQPQVPSLTGQDKILTQEMARARGAGAKLYGATSFEATGSGMGEYMKVLKEKVWLQWFPYLAFSYPADYRSAGCVLRFTLDKEGRLRVIQTVESHGAPGFATFCVEALQKAAPFGPLPPEILAIVGKDELEIFFGFHYQ